MESGLEVKLEEEIDKISHEVVNTFWQTILKISNESYVKEVKIGLTRPVEREDFVDQVDHVTTNLKKLLDLLIVASGDENFYGFINLEKNLKYKVVICILILCGEHLNESDVWTNKETLVLSQRIKEKLFGICKCRTVEELLININSNKLLELVFGILRSKLLKDTWKVYPAAVSSYVWILTSIKMPYIALIMNAVMPTILILIDDYVPSNRVIGLKCLNHICKNVTASELSSYSDLDSLYKLLEPMLYSLEPEMVEPLIKCLVSIINKKLNSENKFKWTYYDEIMKILLPSIEMEQTIALRVAYMETLPFLIKNMGLSTVRWSNRFLRIFKEYALVPCDRENCFRVMYSFIKVTWPRTDCHFEKILGVIVISLYDLISDKEISKNNDKSVEEALRCLRLINSITPEKMNNMLNSFANCKDLSTKFKEYISSLEL